MNQFSGYRLASVALAVTLSLWASAAAGQLRKIGIDVTPMLEYDAAHPGTTVRAGVRAKLEKGYHVNSNAPLDPYLIPTVLSFSPPDGVSVEAIGYPQPVMFTQLDPKNPLAVFEEAFVIGVQLALAAGLAPGEYEVPGRLNYQACDDRVCYAPSSAEVRLRIPVVAADRPLTLAHAGLADGLTFTAASADRLLVVFSDNLGDPRTDRGAARPAPVAEDDDVLVRLDQFVVLGTTGGYLPADDFLEFVEASESGAAQKGLFDDRGPLAIMALTLIGGLALNLTPCVLPMIPINLAIIGAGSRAGSRRRGFALGSAYGLAMAVVYGVLGLVVTLTAGTFGTINSSPWFNLSIAALFVALALAMFDVITIDFTRFQSKIALGGSSKGSFLLAFGMGGVAALLAGACVAPVVIQVIVFASNLYATGTTAALALPFLLGVGMALPWPVAGAGLSFMPKPGPWMVRVKQAFGVFIVGTAVYYGYLSYELFSQRWVDAEEVTSSVEELMKEGWYGSLGQGLQAAQRDNKLVLVDIWATWCKNCLVMDQTTLRDPNVKVVLNDYVKIKFQAEDLGVSPAKEVMARFDAIGLPAYAILRPRS